VARGDCVLTHPDKDEITQRLLKGESVKSVDMWLKMKYPRTKKNHLSWVTLQIFRKNRLNLEGEVLSEIKEERKEQIKQAKEDQKKEIVAQTVGYMQAKKKIADDIIDSEAEILNIHDKVWERIRILEAEQTKHLNDRVICDYLNQARSLLMDFAKLKEMQEKRSGDTNINMVQVNEQISILKQAIREALIEAGVEHVIPIFLSKLNGKLQNVSLGDTREGTVVNAPVLVQQNDSQSTVPSSVVNIQVNNA
jgi:hypothetical protein